MPLDICQIKPRDIFIALALFVFVASLVYSVGRYVGSYQTRPDETVAVAPADPAPPAVAPVVKPGTGAATQPETGAVVKPETGAVAPLSVPPPGCQPTLTVDTEHTAFHAGKDGLVRFNYAVTFPWNYQWKDGGFVVSAQKSPLGRQDSYKLVQLPGTTTLIAGQAQSVGGIVTVRGTLALPAKSGTYPVSFALFSRDWKQLFVWDDAVPVTIEPGTDAPASEATSPAAGTYAVT